MTIIQHRKFSCFNFLPLHEGSLFAPPEAFDTEVLGKRIKNASQEIAILHLIALHTLLYANMTSHIQGMP